MLLRSQGGKTLRGHWAGLSGRIENGERPREAALREMEEEAGFSREDVHLCIEGSPQEIPDGRADTLWIVHPMLAGLEGDIPPRLDWEHAGYSWIFPEEMWKLRTVPGLPETLGLLLGGVNLRMLAPWRSRIQEIVEDGGLNPSEHMPRTAQLLIEMSRSGVQNVELDAFRKLLDWSRPQ